MNTVGKRRAFERTAAHLRPDMLLTRISERRQRVAERLQRAERIVERRLDQFRARLAALDVSLRATPARMAAETGRARDRLNGLALRAESALAGDLSRRRALLSAQDRMLQSLSYRNVLKRGYALVRDEEGAPVKAAGELGPGRAIAIEFADGTVEAVTGSGGGTPPRRKAAKTEAEKPAPRQGSLF